MLLSATLGFMSNYAMAAAGGALPMGSHADANAQFSNARHLWQSGKLKQAAALYESLIRRYPDLPDPYNNLAVIYAAQGDYKKAQQILEKGLNTHPGYAAIYENLTAIYVEMARDSYGKALQFDDKSHRQLKLRSLAELSIKPIQVASAEIPAAGKPDTVRSGNEAMTSTNVATVVAKEEVPVLTSTASVKPVKSDETAEAVAVDQAAIIETLESWASAWSAQSPEQYLSFYEQNFHPAGVSRKNWVALRTARIKRPQWIRVGLSDMSIRPITKKRVRVEVMQRYQSNTYSDNGRKVFTLIQTEQGWRIVDERNQ